MLTIVLTSLASSMDGFACGFLISMKRIKLSVKNLLLISLFPFFIAFFSMSLATFLLEYIDDSASKFLSILLYFILAGYSYVVSNQKKQDETWIDPNQDKQISGFEIVSIGIALSMDTLIVALPLAFLGYPIIPSAIMFGVFNAAMVGLGNYVASKLPDHISRVIENFSWVLYLCLGIRRLF